MSQRLSQINCLMYHEGRCGHPSAKGFFGGRSCVLQAGDPRVTECAVKVEHGRPAPTPAPPPKKPNGPANEILEARFPGFWGSD